MVTRTRHTKFSNYFKRLLFREKPWLMWNILKDGINEYFFRILTECSWCTLVYSLFCSTRFCKISHFSNCDIKLDKNLRLNFCSGRYGQKIIVSVRQTCPLKKNVPLWKKYFLLTSDSLQVIFYWIFFLVCKLS